MSKKTNIFTKQEKLLDRKLAVAMVLTLCTVTSALLFSNITTARYRSEVEGTAAAEPALFNTVLLGNLPFSVKVLTSKEDGTSSYTDVSEAEVRDADGKVIAKKLAASLDVTNAIQFGAVAEKEGSGLANENRKLRPGSVIAIPFTVTNGTTRYVDATDTKEGNIAETDIIYRMTITTTENLPLEYDVYSYTNSDQLAYMNHFGKEKNYTDYKVETSSNVISENWGVKLTSEEEDIQYDEAIGRSQTFTILPEGVGADDADNLKYFKLDRQPLVVNGVEQEAIDIDRYVLMISWPDNSTEDKSTKYMKEIDIIEICLEIESWTESHEQLTVEAAEKGDAATTGLFRIQPKAVGDEANYMLPSGTNNDTFPNAANVFCRGTIPTYAFRKLTQDESKICYYWDFKVTNVFSHLIEWKEETAGAGKYQAQSENVFFTGGKIAVAVPVKAVMGSTNDYLSDEFSYGIEYNGKTYAGRVTDKYITSNGWSKISEGEELSGDGSLYKETEENAYRIIEFSNLTLSNFSDTEAKEQQLRLLITSTDTEVTYDQKDNFKVLIYRTEQASP